MGKFPVSNLRTPCVPSLQGGTPVYDPSLYGSMSLEDLRVIFRSDTSVQLPLMERRLENLHEAAAVLAKVV